MRCWWSHAYGLSLQVCLQRILYHWGIKTVCQKTWKVCTCVLSTCVRQMAWYSGSFCSHLFQYLGFLCLCLYLCVCVCVLYYVAVTDLGGGGVTFFPSPCITVLIHLRSHFDPMVLLYNLHCAKRRACMNANQWCLCVSEKLKELQTQIEVYKGEPFCTVPPPQLDFFLS